MLQLQDCVVVHVVLCVGSMCLNAVRSMCYSCKYASVAIHIVLCVAVAVESMCGAVASVCCNACSNACCSACSITVAMQVGMPSFYALMNIFWPQTLFSSQAPKSACWQYHNITTF